jgi:hypothetical protein
VCKQHNRAGGFPAKEQEMSDEEKQREITERHLDLIQKVVSDFLKEIQSTNPRPPSGGLNDGGMEIKRIEVNYTQEGVLSDVKISYA